MEILLATLADKKGILHLLDEMSVYLHATDVPSQIGGWVVDEILANKHTVIFVAVDDNAIVGLATLYLLPNIRHGRYRGHIEDFVVTSTLRGQGVGTKLMEGIKAYCREQAVSVIKLDSGNELEGAHHFYEKQGGKTTERFFRFDI